MKRITYISILLAFILSALVLYLTKAQSEKDNQEHIIAVNELALIPLKAGSVKPAGWMLEQMKTDLQSGLAGSYEKIWPNVALDLFAHQERQPGNVKVLRGEKVGHQPAWWAGEHEGYWKDAIVRLAFLTDNKSFQARAKKWMEDIMATAKENGGYIGIYSPDSRFPADHTDGELWTQSRIFQAMLAYYEFTGDTEVLNAVEKAASLTLHTYKDKIGTYFGRKGVARHGGVSHAVGFFDTLEWLYRLTGEKKVRDGLIWFYNDFSNNPNQYEDLQLNTLLNKNVLFQGHTPHIMEGMHAPQIIAALTKNQEYEKAASTVIKRLEYHTTPAGNFVGDELVRGRKGTGEMWGEYCSMTEGVSSLNKIISWGGSLEAADRIENTVMNAAQAARFHPNNIAVQYLGRDNQFSAADRDLHNGRTVYAGYHRAAACCTLNSTRIMPYYVDGMWYALKDGEGLFAMLYGESSLETQIKGVDIHIKEGIFYPFEDKLTFNVKPKSPVKFKLKLRIPEGAGEVSVDAGKGAIVERNDKVISIENLWEGSQEVKVDFDFQTRVEEAKDSTYYVSRGPLLYSLPIEAKVMKTEELKLIGNEKSGFFEYSVTPEENGDHWQLSLEKDSPFRFFEFQDQDKLHPWTKSPSGVLGAMVNKKGEVLKVPLVPHGTTLLRRLTFPVNKIQSTVNKNIHH